MNSDQKVSVLSYDVSSSDVQTESLGIAGLNIQSKSDALTSLGNIDVAIDSVNRNRADLGALQSRLQSTVNNLQITNENLSYANSLIRDADMAAESTELAKSNILAAASTAVLAQANFSANDAIRLLG